MGKMKKKTAAQQLVGRAAMTLTIRKIANLLEAPEILQEESLTAQLRAIAFSMAVLYETMLLRRDRVCRLLGKLSGQRWFGGEEPFDSYLQRVESHLAQQQSSKPEDVEARNDRELKDALSRYGWNGDPHALACVKMLAGLCAPRELLARLGRNA